MTTASRTTPATILMAIAGDASPLHLLALTAWLLTVAFAAGCVVAVMGVFDSLPGLARPGRTPRRMQG